MANPFPPAVPKRWAGQIVIEEVDASTIRIKKSDGTVLKTMTKTEYDQMHNPTLTPSQG